jgi:hypothetical protein
MVSTREMSRLSVHRLSAPLFSTYIRVFNEPDHFDRVEALQRPRESRDGLVYVGTIARIFGRLFV